MTKEYVSVVIVDDDDMIREFLEKKIDWAASGYELAGTAEDGISGLELIEELEPDIVICDILMPCMDGLTMLKEMKSRGHHPRVIIFSGHDEFEYARTAIRLSVDAYINKPLDEAGLFEVLNQTRERLENEHYFSTRIKDSFPLLRQAFLSRLLSGYYNDTDSVWEQANYLEITIDGDLFLCVAARIDPLSPEIRKRNALGREFLKTIALKLARDTLEEFCQVYSCDTGETSFAMLLVKKTDEPESSTAILVRQLEELIHLTQIRTRVPLTLGLGSPRSDIASIPIAYGEALKALSCDHLLGVGRIISIQDINPNGKKNSWKMQEAANELARAVRVADINLVEQQLSHLRHQIMTGLEVSMIQIKMDASVMAFAVINEADCWLKEDRPEAQRAFTKVYLEIQELGTIDEILGVLKNFAAVIISLIENTRRFHYQTILHKAMAFIESNYQDPELSLDRTAVSAGVSQSHLGFLFKKRMQSSFHKYLTKIRIEKAMLLLQENDFKTYEVAEMVGYSNAQYFSVSFKKYTGKSPLQFRNMEVSV